MKLNLKNITAIIVDGFNPANKNAEVLNYCADLCDFHSIKLASFEEPSIRYDYDFCKINRISYLEYNYFIVKELSKYIESDYALVMNHDGYIVNTKSWNDDFLKYDYIGAPWYPGTLRNARVGNGGFSLRSKKLLDRCAKDDFVFNGIGEDITICSLYKDLLESEGFTFAPIEVAAKFSWGGNIPEISRSWKDCFGAHIGKPNSAVSQETCDEFANLIKRKI